MDGTEDEVFLVGDLTVDVGQQRVTRAGAEVAMPNLSFQFLVALIRVAPNVLSQELLMARVWPGLVVSPESVNKRANLLREALGDDAQEPRYVAGVRSRGYRLIAEVSLATRSPSVAAPAGETSARVAAGRSRMWWLAVPALVAAACAIVWGVRLANAPHASATPSVDDTLPPESSRIGARERTVAVLPFENISAASADAYLAQGIPEMILNRMSQIPGLSVIARGSSFAPGNKTVGSRELGRRLNSAYLVDGSVQREANRLRIAVQLVDTTAGTQIWSTRFDRDMSDIFNVEDEIAEQVAVALSERIGNLESKPVASERSSNIEAYLAFLHGRSLLGRFTVAESDAAVPFLEKATSLDPHFAAAFASLYDAHLQAADQRHDDLAPVRQRYAPLIDRALAIDAHSGTAYFARAMWGNGTNEARDADFRRGTELDPSNGRGLTAYAEFLDWDYGRPEQATRVLQRALWIDPMSPRAHFHAAKRSLDEGGAKTAEQNVLEVLELDPDFVPALQNYAYYRWLFDGKLAEAIQIIEHAIALDPKNPWLRHTAMAIYLDVGDEQAARDVAAGTPQSARAEGLLSMYAGDWRAAARASYDAAGWTYDYCQNFLAAESLRDAALQTGESARAMAFIESKYYFQDDPAAHLDVCNYHAAVYLSQLLSAGGQTEEARSLLRAAASWNDANSDKYLGRARRVRASIMLLDGKQDAALAELAESFRAGCYVFWWYTLDHDPQWLPLHGDPRFAVISREVRHYVDGQRAELEVMRHRGDVPRRGKLPVLN